MDLYYGQTYQVLYSDKSDAGYFLPNTLRGAANVQDFESGADR